MIFVYIGGIIVFFAYETAYFSFGEAVIMGASSMISLRFLINWYAGAVFSTKFFHAYIKRIILFVLPLMTTFLYLQTLLTVASADVVDARLYIIMYLFLGIAWLYITLQGCFLFFDFSYRDDVLTGNHTAPLITCVFSCLAISLIYAGANVGDGPGWWTVVFAGGLGTVTWLLLGSILNKTTRLVQQVIMDKNVASSIRLGSFLLAAGIILAWASSGDWTSFGVTVIEFLVGWPVIPLTVLVILLEHTVFKSAKEENRAKSIVVSLVYLLIAVIVVIQPFILPGNFF